MPPKIKNRIPKDFKCRTCGSDRTYSTHLIEGRVARVVETIVYSCDKCSAIFWDPKRWFVSTREVSHIQI